MICGAGRRRDLPEQVQRVPFIIARLEGKAKQTSRTSPASMSSELVRSFRASNYRMTARSSGARLNFMRCLF
jgi:hypothetical protein